MSAAGVERVMFGSRFIVSKGGQEPTIHELALHYYRSLGGGGIEKERQWAKMYVETAASVIARQFPIQERSVPAQKHRITLLETEEGLLAKAKEMANQMFQDMLDQMAEKVRQQWEGK